MALAPKIFASLADPTRLRIVMLLRAMELSVGEIAQVLGQSQPRVSRHVKILIDAGLAERRKEGSWVFLSLGARARIEPLFQLLDRWAELDGDNPWVAADAARLAAVRADRAAAAERYFASHAGSWDALRSLHVAESEVEAAIGRALGKTPIGRLIDIGTGTGRMIELFAPRCGPGARHRPSPGDAAAGPRQAGGGRARLGRAAPGRHVCAAARLRLGRHGDHPPGAALCAESGRRGGRGGAAAVGRAGGC